MSLDYFSALLIGLLGAGHCLGMCGGVTGMLTSALGQQQKSTQRARLVLAYNLGRIGSYTLLGAIVGFTGSIAAKNIGLPIAGLRLVAAIFLIFLGLYIGQWLMWLSHVERLGKGLWQKLAPLNKRLIPVNSSAKALGLGALWGWLPCGLVYSTLTWSIASGNAVNGALIMLFFGLGTLPALFTMSLGILSLKNLLKNFWFRQVTAVLLIIYGIYSLVIAYQLLF